MKEYCYKVAGHSFSVLTSGNADLSHELAHYAPFAICPDTASERIFRLQVVSQSELPVPGTLVEEFTQDDDGSQIRLCHTDDGSYWFEFSLCGRLTGRMLAEPGYKSATLAILCSSEFALSNALMVMYAMSSAQLGTVLFHAAVIGHAGRGYLFLGKSGTGKSTHARLWLKYVPGSELVNDDNPVVRVLDDGTVRVYGSPWSGKTPCYRNMDLPVGGFVQLAQAPKNEIRQLRGIETYAALVSSISGQRWDRRIADGLHETENALATRIRGWHLDCLPDEAAALLCSSTVTKA